MSIPHVQPPVETPHGGRSAESAPGVSVWVRHPPAYLGALPVSSHCRVQKEVLTH